MLIIKKFLESAAATLRAEENILGLAVGGSWLTKELDRYSDLDLIIVTKNKIAVKGEMISYARRLGNLLQAFTGEHVSEPRLLICLFDNPLLHVDIKFLMLHELEKRIEDPEIIFDTNHQLATVIASTTPQFPLPDHQWIEDRFWIWVHYIASKIERGEWYEAVDALSFLRANVLGPLLHMKNNSLPRGVRKLEAVMNKNEADLLVKTIAAFDKNSLRQALQISIALYRNLRNELYGDIKPDTFTENKVMEYLQALGI